MRRDFIVRFAQPVAVLVDKDEFPLFRKGAGAFGRDFLHPVRPFFEAVFPHPVARRGQEINY